MRALLLAVAAVALVPAAAQADVSIRIPADPDALTYGAGRVLWATHTTHGPIVVRQALGSDGRVTTLATIARTHPSSADLAVSLAANASGFVLTARDGRLIQTGECGCDYDVSQGELVVRGGFDGSMHDVVRCVPRRDPRDAQPSALAVTAGRAGFALSGVLCGAPAPVDTVGADGVVTPLPGVEASIETTPSGEAIDSQRSAGGVSYAEPFLAVRGTVKGAPQTTSLHVIDTVTGARRDLDAPSELEDGPFQVLGDGTVLLGPYTGTEPALSIFRWSPGDSAPHAIPNAQLPPLSDFAATDTRLLYAATSPVAGRLALGLMSLDGTVLRAVGAPGAGADRRPLGLDDTTAAFVSESCTGATQVTIVDLTATSASSLPDGCPVQVRDRTIRFDRKGRGTAHVVCPNGCAGPLRLYIELRPRQLSARELNRYVNRVLDSRLANAKLTLSPAPTARRVRITLVRPALALLRRHHRRLRVFPSVNDDIGAGPELAGPARTIVARLAR